MGFGDDFEEFHMNFIGSQSVRGDFGSDLRLPRAREELLGQLQRLGVPSSIIIIIILESP